MLDDNALARINEALTIAKALYSRGRLAEASHACSLVLRLDPANAPALIRLGLIARNQHQPDEAARHFASALAAEPHNLYAARLLAAAYREGRRLDDAGMLLDVWLQKAPGDSELLVEKGRCLLDRGDPAAAAPVFEAAIAATPDNAPAHSLLGICRRRTGDRDGAFAAFSAAAALDPTDVSALNGLGNHHLERENYPAAIDHFRRALAVRPGFAKAQKNLAYTLSLAGEIGQAREAFDRLLQLRPDFPEGHMDYGLFLLSIGDYAGGWEEYEHRWQFDGFRERDWSDGLPRWDGEPLRGRHLLLWGEQGIGDHILYGTMLPETIGRAAGRITIAVEDRLVPLFARSLAFADVQVVARGAPVEADVHCPFASLGRWMRRTPADFHDGVFLRPDLQRAAELRARYAALGQPGDRLMGLSWRSANWHVGGYKSINLKALLPVLQRPGVTWISLQYGNADEEIAALARNFGITVHRDPDVDATRDLDGLAAQITALDAVVSSSNSTVHFAGALGKPCHVLLAQGRGRMWYWPRQGERSPWYGSVRLMRQAVPGDWSSALQRLAAALDGI